MYYIISLKHTFKDRFITLWGKNNCGYFTSLEGAGLYETPEPGYHDSGNDNMPITKEQAERLAITVEQDKAEYHCIPNCQAVWDALNLKWHKGNLIRTKQKEVEP